MSVGGLNVKTINVESRTNTVLSKLTPSVQVVDVHVPVEDTTTSIGLL